MQIQAKLTDCFIYKIYDKCDASSSIIDRKLIKGINKV